MSEINTINTPYQIHKGLLNPEKWEEGLWYIVFYHDGSIYIRKRNNLRVSGPHLGTPLSLDTYDMFGGSVSHTVGPISDKFPVESPPPMLNRWRAFSRQEETWFNGTYQHGYFYDQNGDTKNYDYIIDTMDLSTFETDRMGDLPEKIQQAVMASRQV